MKLTKTQRNKIVNHARKLFIEETAGWIKKKSIGKVGISPSGVLQWKNMLAWGLVNEELQLKWRLEKYLSETLDLDVYCLVLLIGSDDGINLKTIIEDWDEKELLSHREKVIEFKDRIVRKVLAN